MKRKKLIADIKAIDSRLSEQLPAFRQQSERAINTLHEIHPGWLIGGGLAAGAISGWLGLRAMYAASLVGFRLTPLITAGFSKLVDTGAGE